MAKIEGNSFASKENREQTPKVKQIVTDAKIKKESELTKFGKNLLSQDAKSVKENVVKDVVVPKIKDLAVSAIKYAADFIFYGSRSGSQQQNGPRTVQYSSLYSNSYHNQYGAADVQNTKNSIYNVNDVTFNTRADAENVLFSLKDALHRYGVVSVSDYYDTFGGAHDFTANKYGWRDLSNAEIVRVRERYSIIFPKVVPIE